jgi:hypothetical protein
MASQEQVLVGRSTYHVISFTRFIIVILQGPHDQSNTAKSLTTGLGIADTYHGFWDNRNCAHIDMQINIRSICRIIHFSTDPDLALLLESSCFSMLLDDYIVTWGASLWNISIVSSAV